MLVNYEVVLISRGREYKPRWRPDVGPTHVPHDLVYKRNPFKWVRFRSGCEIYVSFRSFICFVNLTLRYER